MEKIDIHALTIHILPGSPTPILTAAQLLSTWLAEKTGVAVPIYQQPASEQSVFQIQIGVLDQLQILEQIRTYQLPTRIRHDGYVLAHRDNRLLIYSQVPRGVVYACGYEIPRRLSIQEHSLTIDFDTILEEPSDILRGWSSWGRDYTFSPHAAAYYRLNLTWIETSASGEVFLPGEVALQPFIAPHEAEIRQRRTETDTALTLAKAYGLEVFIGGLNSIWVLPDYLMKGLAQCFTDVVAHSYMGGSEWPPYEWQDRPNLCPSNPVTRRIYTALVDEFLTAHPQADGICMGFGYDGYPLGCGCQSCRSYSYAERFRDQAMLVFDVAVKKHGKKLWLWTWVVGGASAIPGYEHYFGWVKPFAESNPKSVYISSFATEGDFNLTHRPNPVIGSRGPNDLGNVLIWPEYRGDGVVPAWLVDWMGINLPALREQGACGFVAMDAYPSRRERDVIQAAEWYAFGEMTWNAKKSAEQVAAEYCTRTFGQQAAPFVVGALRKSSEVIRRTLYLPNGARFSGHSHIENDLRTFWEVYTLYDSAPFFLSEEQRRAVYQAGPPYQPKIEAELPGLACTADNIISILQDKEQAIADAGWMIAQAELARPYLTPELYEQLINRFGWIKNYARLFRGLAQAFFHLRAGKPHDGEEVIAGANEMEAAMQVLPQDGTPLPYDLDPQFGSYPWMITPPGELIHALKAAGELLIHNIHQRPVAVFGSEETITALESLYLPYRALTSLNDDLSSSPVLVLGPAAPRSLTSVRGKLIRYVRRGGCLLIYNPSENWQAIPATWLPGRVQPWMCNHPKVWVTQPAHPIVRGYNELKAEPITRFQATSAQVLEARRFSPFIKSFVAVSQEWQTLTYPPALAETTWGKGRVIINLIPENRTILLRALAYLYQFHHFAQVREGQPR